jgi:hypothetical protein
MLDWLTKPADWLLSAGSAVASWFIDKDTDAARFAGMQMMIATLVLAAAVHSRRQRPGARVCLFRGRDRPADGDAPPEAR